MDIETQRLFNETAIATGNGHLVIPIPDEPVPRLQQLHDNIVESCLVDIPRVKIALRELTPAARGMLPEDCGVYVGIVILDVFIDRYYNVLDKTSVSFSSLISNTEKLNADYNTLRELATELKFSTHAGQCTLFTDTYGVVASLIVGIVDTTAIPVKKKRIRKPKA